MVHGLEMAGSSAFGYLAGFMTTSVLLMLLGLLTAHYCYRHGMLDRLAHVYSVVMLGSGAALLLA